ncbi:hypothetical protein F6Y05_04015 [Bacillus megaterium]|nr:hypothetical protein [Priestia megaterium]
MNKCSRIISTECSRSLDGHTNGAVYYYNPTTATNKWIFTRKAYKRIGSHVFAY